MAIVWPVRKLQASDIRKMIRLRSSSIWPNRRIGIWLGSVAPADVSGIGFSFSQAPSVGNGPGATAFSLMPKGPHSTASDMVIAWIAVLAMAEGVTKAEPVKTQVTRLLTTEPLIPSLIQRLPMARVT